MKEVNIKVQDKPFKDSDTQKFNNLKKTTIQDTTTIINQSNTYIRTLYQKTKYKDRSLQEDFQDFNNIKDFEVNHNMHGTLKKITTKIQSDRGHKAHAISHPITFKFLSSRMLGQLI